MKPETPAPRTYQSFTVRDWRVYLHPEFPEALADLVVVNSKAFQRAGFEAVASSPFAKVYRGTVEIAERTYCLYLKHYLYRSPIDVAKHFFRSSRAMRSFRAAALLNERGLSCPVVVAVGLRRPLLSSVPLLNRLPFCWTSTTLTLSVEGACPLHEYWWNHLNTLAKKRGFLEALGTEIGYMHSQRLVHGDLRSGNIYIEEESEGWRFCLLDNERTRRFRRVPQAQIVKNLVQVHLFIHDVTQTDRARFFRAYLRQHPMSRPEQLSLARDVMQKTARREAQKANRSR
ncbi:MAG: hypothetical protein IIA65_07800 [Planctomycetes bacterium]|nr:hypothetical protein [Planctomycetota bacterium]